jgi:hypothetical protein
MAIPPVKEQYTLVLEDALERLADLVTAKKMGWTAGVEEFIASRRGAGMADDAIFRALREDLDEGGPIFGSLRSRVEQAFQVSLEQLGNEIQKTAYEEDLGETLDNQRWMWVATLENTCPDCMELHGQVKTYAEWEEEGVPNIAPTICTLRSACRCNLVPMEYMSDADRKSVIEPVKLQKERIKEYARQRKEEGVSLSAEYKRSLLGQANNEEGIIK